LSGAAYAGVVAWCCVLAPRVAELTATIGAVGGLLLAFVLVRGVDDVLGAAVLLAGACYVLGLLAGHHALDDGAPLVGVGLLACGELATWSLEARPPVPGSAALTRARAGAIGVLLLAGLAASALVVAVAAAPVGSGLAWVVLGAAAAVVAIGLVARLSIR